MVTLSRMLLCSKKATSIPPLSSACVNVFFLLFFFVQYVCTSSYFVVAVLSEPPTLVSKMSNPPCGGKEQKTRRKLARTTRAVTADAVTCGGGTPRLSIFFHLWCLRSPQGGVLASPVPTVPGTITGTARTRWSRPFRDPRVRPRHSWTDSPGCGTSWKANSCWCDAAMDRRWYQEDTRHNRRTSSRQSKVYFSISKYWESCC